MKRPETDSELRDLIVGTLENHKEHYLLGSWEAFAKKRAKKRRLFFLFSGTGIAATFLAGWLGFSFFFESGTVTGSAYALSDQNGMTPVPDSSVTATVTDINLTDSATASNNAIELVQDDNKVESSSHARLDEAALIPAKRGSNEGIIQLKGLKYSNSVELISDLKIQGKQANTLNDDLNTNSNEPLIDENNYEPSAHKRRLRLGVTFSPGMTSTATASSYNYSGGLSAEVLITGKLSLAAGLQLEHQNVVNKKNDNPSWLPQGKDEALLTALELPLNVTWEFNEKRSSSFYLSGGVSSIAWIGERYTSTYFTQVLVPEVRNTQGEESVSYVLENIENKAVNTTDPLSTFSLAGRLNLMAGYRKKINGTMSVHVGPFIKIPISEQATERLRYSISGVTCKLSF